ncbi:MAG: histidine phosphatase family protein [Deltaproteobacteria bacterium]|nr:MAG: histidine phosphatase family protein [Deltaproteobacteria bacterium]
MEWPWRTSHAGRIVVLVRHGRTSWNAQQRFLGRTDVGLDEVGIAQARGLFGLAEEVDRVWCSPLSRARQTAEALGSSPEIVDALIELDQGLLEGLDGPTAFARWPEFFRDFASEPDAVVVPGGESLGTLQSRALGVLSEAPPGRTAMVSHQMVIASLRAAIAGAPLRHWRKYRVDNATVTVLEETGEGWAERIAGWRPPGSDASSV